MEESPNEPWLERWEIGRTGWHETDGNQGLKRHWTAQGRRVLVPLCGKTPDLLWLESRGNAVTGVEVSEIAVRGFFEDNALEYTRREGLLDCYAAKDRNITIYCGDFFDFDQQPFDAHYDRGALIALDAATRPRYAAHTRSLLSDEAAQLLITIEYDQEVCDGPPFSVREAEIHGYWPRLVRAEVYDDTANSPPKFLAAGLRRLDEVVWLGQMPAA